jgi:hypothetical protein
MKKFTRDRVVPIISASLLTHVWRYRLGRVFFAEAGQYYERSRQALFARIEQLIDQVRLSAVVSFDRVRNKQVGELVFRVEGAQHLFPFNPQTEQSVMAVAVVRRTV